MWLTELLRLAGQCTHMSHTMRSNPSPLRFYPGAVHCRFQELPFPQNFRLLAVANLCHLCNNLCCWYCFSWQLNYTTQLKTMEPAFASSMVFLFKDFCYSPCLLFKYNSHCSSFTNYAIEFNMCSKAIARSMTGLWVDFSISVYMLAYARRKIMVLSPTSAWSWLST